MILSLIFVEVNSGLANGRHYSYLSLNSSAIISSFLVPTWRLGAWRLLFQRISNHSMSNLAIRGIRLYHTGVGSVYFCKLQRFPGWRRRAGGKFADGIPVVGQWGKVLGVPKMFSEESKRVRKRDILIALGILTKTTRCTSILDIPLVELLPNHRLQEGWTQRALEPWTFLAERGIPGYMPTDTIHHFLPLLDGQVFALHVSDHRSL
jgi:hypothetical protein